MEEKQTIFTGLDGIERIEYWFSDPMYASAKLNIQIEKSYCLTIFSVWLDKDELQDLQARISAVVAQIEKAEE